MSLNLPVLEPREQFGPRDSDAALEVPYAPYSKSDKLGRIADWTQDANRQDMREGRRGRFRDQYHAYGAGQASVFGYQHDDDEATFSIVDSRSTNRSRLGGGGGRPGFLRGRGRGGALQSQRGRGGAQFRGGRFGGQGGYGDAASGRGNWGRGRRGGWKDWDLPKRMKESSVNIRPDWVMLEEIEFSRLSKLNLEASDPVDVESSGTLYYYDRRFDKITTKIPMPFQITERFGQDFTIGTLEDPTLDALSRAHTATVYATDAIISMLMCASRSVNPWDIVIIKSEGQIFFDKRTGGPIDLVSVNENAVEPPPEPMTEDPNNPGQKPTVNVPKINTAPELREEAFYVVTNFTQQTVKASETEKVTFQNPVPFEEHAEDEDIELASRGYRYRKFDLSLVDQEQPTTLLVRTEVDAVQKAATGQESLITIKALNEFGTGTPGQIDWRTKLDSQRGAVVATEMKNNNCKLARWAIQSTLAGADVMKVGYISRVNPKDNRRHTILGVGSYKPREFVTQMNFNINNGWGIVRNIIDMCMKQEDGKFLLVKDPNKPILRFYKVSDNAFEELDDELVAKDEEGEEAGE